jgi:microcystin-dependent protein
MEPYLGQISLFAFDYVPPNWARCEGQILNIAQYPALYSLLGNAFGGVLDVSFGLPNLRGKAAVGIGQGPGLTNRGLGNVGGSERIQLLATQIPAHNHTLEACTSAANVAKPTSACLLADSGASGPALYYTTSQANSALHPDTIGTEGGNGAHENRQPYLPMTWAICIEGGIYPSRG